MLYNNRYELDVKVNNKSIDTYPSNYTFTLYDSIFNLYPRAKFVFNDVSGQFNEYMAFINGTNLEITVGTKNNSISCSYVVTKNGNSEQLRSGQMGGHIELSLLHDYYFKQSKISSAFRDDIYNIIKKKAIAGGFTSSNLNIDLTQNPGIWYQPLITDADFMAHHLLPYSFSNDASNSPFYLFINSANTFNFTSYKKMFHDAKEIDTFTLIPGGTIFNVPNTSILKFNTLQQTIPKIYDTFHRLIYNFDSSGDFQSVEDFINQYPNNSSDPIAIQKDLKPFTELFELIHDDLISQETVNLNRGHKAFRMRNAFHIDKAMITVNLNTDLVAGKKINVRIPSGSEKDNKDFGIRFSGDWLVEATYHTWNSKIASTVAILSRQDVRVNNSYSKSKEIIKR